MGRLTPKLTQTASKIAVTRNEFADIVYGATSNSACLFRDISILNRGAGNREEINIDGILWFDADEVVAKGDVYLLDGVYLRIEKIIIARKRLTDNTVDFIKCEVTKQRQVS